MLTTIIVAAAISGCGDCALFTERHRRDPFVSPQNYEIVRIIYLIEALRSAGIEDEYVHRLLTDDRLSHKALPPLPPPPTEAKEWQGWHTTASHLLSDNFVMKAKEYREANLAALQQPGMTVSAEHLTALIGLESRFGKTRGSFVATNVLYRILLRRPRDPLQETDPETKRWHWAVENLVALVRYCLKYDIDFFEPRGSYMAAVGIVQFLFPNIFTYGVDTNHDGRVDLGDISEAAPSADRLLVADDWTKSHRDSYARYYTGKPATHPGNVEGRAYADILLLFAEAIDTPLEKLPEIRGRAMTRFPEPRKKAGRLPKKIADK